MIKRTLCFSNPAYLTTHFEQLVIELPGTSKSEQPPPKPIEDLGIVILDNPQITITHTLLSKLAENNTAVVICDARHMPNAMFLPYSGHSLTQQKVQQQMECSVPLRKNLWQQTVKCKILNQAAVLDRIGKPSERLYHLVEDVKTGDSSNHEGQAAVFYWKNFIKFDSDSDVDPFHDARFLRDRYGDSPNHLLNYGYAVLRAIIARAIVGAGLLPVLGIHHRNQYNPFCLADDIMEPFRPFVDLLVVKIMATMPVDEHLTPALKRELLTIATADTIIDGNRSPLFVAAQKTAASLSKCFAGEARKIIYPEIP
jgi:CRISP-associated protein Cas1